MLHHLACEDEVMLRKDEEPIKANMKVLQQGKSLEIFDDVLESYMS